MFWRVMLGIALGVLSGGLVVLAAPAQGFGWLVLVAGVPMIVAQYHVMPARFAGIPTALGYGIAAPLVFRAVENRVAALVAALVLRDLTRRWRSGEGADGGGDRVGGEGAGGVEVGGAAAD